MNRKDSSKVPMRRFYGEAMSALVYALQLNHLAEEKSGAPTLLGYGVPDFQRPDDRWSVDQQKGFIESMYLGANIGAFMVNLPVAAKDPGIDNILLDGLQRMTALKAYFRGQFGIAGEDGVDRRWGDLTASDQAHLLRLNFPWILTRYDTRQEAILAYERHNFGGTPHTAEDRAKITRALMRP